MEFFPMSFATPKIKNGQSTESEKRIIVSIKVFSLFYFTLFDLNLFNV